MSQDEKRAAQAAAARDDEDSNSSSSSAPELEAGAAEKSATTADDGAPTGPVFNTEEEALAGRVAGLSLFNSGQIDAALAVQASVLRYFTEAHGELSPKIGLYYLDYGLSLLTLVQSQAPDAAALAGNAAEGADNSAEDLEIAHENLESARLCLEKAVNEAPDGSDEEKKQILRLSEVHDALAQVHLERDDESSALEEFNRCLQLRQDESSGLPKAHRQIVSCMYSIAMTYGRAEMYEQAAPVYEEALKLATESEDIDPALVEDLRASIDEANEMAKRGADLKKEIQECFPDESSQVKHPDDSEQPAATTSAKKTPKTTSKKNSSDVSLTGMFSTEVPREILESNKSASALESGFAPPFGAGGSGNGGYGENSQSVSLFPRQVNSMSGVPTGALSNGPINTVVAVRKKPRRENSMSQQQRSQEEMESAEPAEKRRRTETGESK